NAQALVAALSEDDVVVLHDPQTAGLIPAVRERGVPVVWRCHIGADADDDRVLAAQKFLVDFVCQADALVFSREDYIWHGVDHDHVTIIKPTIDAFSPKNQDLEAATARAILQAAGLRTGRPASAPAFRRMDGTTEDVTHRATVHGGGGLGPDDRFVLQVSRWDALKDPLGVIRGFAEHAAAHTDAHLVYAGPAVEAVADDPEGAAVLRDARQAWDDLPSGVRERVHLALLPMDDLEENAAIVNALQREASVVVQKSLAEGFGLTVAEAMWKARPVVASRVGGIQDQIEHGDSGVLLDDARDLAAYGEAVLGLLHDEALAAALGHAARERVRDHFLGSESLLHYLDLLQPLLARRDRR
ncbi:MAG: glycosyltransferase, partial [Solirubrobacterales bacterium]|nr:glycosyltransferase [Solirubrobacterales bacterium]